MQEPLQAEGEADPAVVAGAPQDAGQAVVAAAAADLDGAVGRRRHDLEDHLRVEADAAAEAQVELDAVEVDAVVLQRARPGRGATPPSRAQGLVLAAEAVEDVGRRPLQVGQGVDAVADPLQRGVQAVAEVPLAAEPVDDLVPRTPPGDDGDERPEEAVDPAVVGPLDRRRDLPASASPAWSQPESCSRPSSSDSTPLPSVAASLSISIRAARVGSGSPERSSVSRIRPTWPRRIVAPFDPGLGQRPVGEPDDLAVGERAPRRRGARRRPAGTRGAGRAGASRAGRRGRRG